MALCDLAIELIYVKQLVEFCGYESKGSVEACTDNKGAFDLCHRFTSSQHSRHVDRKLFKMRELRGAGTVVVKHIPTESNPADMFTKVLTRQVFRVRAPRPLRHELGGGRAAARRAHGDGGQVQGQGDLSSTSGGVGYIPGEHLSVECDAFRHYANICDIRGHLSLAFMHVPLHH